MFYRLRVTQGEHVGHWLTRITVSKNGLPLAITDWAGVESNLDQYDLYPEFYAGEQAAWSGVALEAAERFQRLLMGRGIAAEIVEGVSLNAR